MARRSLVGAFRDAKTRPRAIIWSAIALLGVAALFVIAGVIVTSTQWFCATPCHMVQTDAIAAYEASSHSEVSCMACHEPANGTPVEFLFAKIRSAGEVLPTVTKNYELPPNLSSAYSLGEEMESEQCTQCHGTNRKITPAGGIIIDHAVHEEADVTCATCHNRVGHNDEAITQKLTDNVKHKDFMKMDACFRCHDLENKRRAGGECKLCHPAGFDLVPETHDEKGWLPKGHAEAATESLTEYGAATVEAEELVKEGVAEDVAVPVEYCSTCHKKPFCDACHSKLAGALKLTSGK